MKKSIFNVYVEIENEYQFYRLCELCKSYSLDVDDVYFSRPKYFMKSDGFFSIFSGKQNQIKVTESEFVELLKEYKNES